MLSKYQVLGVRCCLSPLCILIGPRLCSLSVSELAVKNSASVKIRIETVCDHAAQKIYDQIDDFSIEFRCVLEAVPDALYLAVFDNANKLFVPPMMHPKMPW